MAPPPAVAAAFDAPRIEEDAVARRRAMLLALPLRAEAPTPEEDAIFEEAERFLRSGQRGHTTEEIQALLEQMRRDAGE